MLGQSKIVFAIAHTTSYHVSGYFPEFNLPDGVMPVKSNDNSKQLWLHATPSSGKRN